MKSDIFFIDVVFITWLYASLPEWAHDAIKPNGTMEYIVGFYHKMYADTPEMSRIESGLLIREMYERFEQKVNGTLQPNRSAWFYSAHSITISFMLNSLGLFEVCFINIPWDKLYFATPQRNYLPQLRLRSRKYLNSVL